MDELDEMARAKRRRAIAEAAAEANQPHALLRVFCDVCGLRHGSGPPSQPSIVVVPVAADWTTLECPRCGGRRSTARLLTEDECNPPPADVADPPT